MLFCRRSVFQVLHHYIFEDTFLAFREHFEVFIEAVDLSGLLVNSVLFFQGIIHNGLKPDSNASLHSLTL